MECIDNYKAYLNGTKLSELAPIETGTFGLVIKNDTLCCEKCGTKVTLEQTGFEDGMLFNDYDCPTCGCGGSTEKVYWFE